jgi:transcriptional regulator with XRE-family HTH domain
MAKGKYEYWLTSDGLTRLEAYARDGLTDEQIAHNMGISAATLYNYKNNHIEILEALKRGKEVVDIEVENKLLQRAKGYEYIETTYERIENMVVEPDGSVNVIPGTKIKTVVKQMAPDVTAQIFWLKNRKSAEWRDKAELEHSGKIELPNITISK